MLRVFLLALALAACSRPGENGTEPPVTSSLEYPNDPLPADVLANMGLGPDINDYEAVQTLLESAEPEMVRLRRSMTPIILKIDNLPIEDPGLIWTLMSFHGAMPEGFEGSTFEGRWIARRVRKLWDGQTIIDWADSDGCEGMMDQLAHITDLHPPIISLPVQDDATQSGAKLTLDLDRSFTLWTTWAPAYDLRFSGQSESEIGQWAIRLASHLQPCWSSTEPHGR